MSHLLLISDSAELRQHVADAARTRISVIGARPIPTGPSQLFQQLGSGAAIPQIVLIDTDAGLDDALSLSGRLSAEVPGMAIILFSEQPDSLALAALRAGARDVVRPDADPDELRDVLNRAVQSVNGAQQGHGDPASNGNASTKGRVIAVVSPKGGVGKTTVASNLAVGLARAAPLSTVLVDLDVQFGDVASALNLDPDYTLLDVIRGPAVQDSMVLKTFLTQHPTGLYTVCAPLSPADADEVTTADIVQLLQTLAAEFRYVVLDTAPGLNDHALAAMDQADDLLLLTSLDVPGVRAMRKELDILRDLGLSFEGRHMVVNFADSHSGLSKSDVEATIGTGVTLLLPRHRGVLASVNQGVPLLQNDGRDPATKQLRKLVGRFTTGAMQSVDTTEPTPVGGRHRVLRKRAQR
ncbi:AAA family ATPase [Dietzia lutea]|uniref:AAA family ATPase n=1 Tax=Dietzia lutea TaxID=546160 RepID=UPI000D551919|nr:AAA family ATPase [Dietzia lutea]